MDGFPPTQSTKAKLTEAYRPRTNIVAAVDNKLNNIAESAATASAVRIVYGPARQTIGQPIIPDRQSRERCRPADARSGAAIASMFQF